MIPITVLENMLHGEEYHNPEDLEKIAKLEAVVKKLEALVAKETKVQKQSTKARVETAGAKKSAMGRAKRADLQETERL